MAELLRNDAKNQAENRMIVDLLGNDISRIGAVLRWRQKVHA